MDNLYAIFDRKSSSFSGYFFAPSEVEAKRALITTLVYEDTYLFLHAEDFVLFCCGSMCSDSGAFVSSVDEVCPVSDLLDAAISVRSRVDLDKGDSSNA